MKQQVKLILTAIMFYSRIPVPKSTGYSDEQLNKATRYFPLVGIIIGSLGAGVFWGVHHVFSQTMSIVIAMISMILATGAFHEDAFSDFCDGFGGGYTHEKILSIMKDSRIGTYGATGLVLLLLSKVFLLTEINPVQIPFILIAAHALSRVISVIMIYTSQYVRFDDSSKSKPIGQKHSTISLIVAIFIGIVPLFLIPYMYIPVIIGVLLLAFLYFRYYVHKVLGGYTGDVLGALQQISEVGFYVAYICCCKLM